MESKDTSARHLAPRLAAASALGAGALACLALAGWMLEVERLRSFVPGLVAMNPATAVALLFGAAALWAQRDGRASVPGRLFALVLFLLGAWKVGAVLLDLDAGIDRFLFPARLDDGLEVPNRMAPNTAVCLALLGSALALLRKRVATAQALALASGSVSFFALLGHVYGLADLYRFAAFIPMALNTSVALTALAFGALAAQPRHGLTAVLSAEGPGGYLARRLLPAAVLLPACLGALRFWGESAGLYATVTGGLLVIVASILLMTGLVWLTARALERSDRERLAAENANRESSLLFESIFENIPHMVFVKEARELRFVKFNRAGGKLLNCDPRELIGKNDYDFFPRRQADFFTTMDRHVLSQGEIMEIPEEPIETSRGTRTLHTRKVPLPGPDGGPAYLLGISEDITERKRAHEARLRLAAIVDSTDDAILSKNLDGTILSWNEGAERLYGYGAEETIGRHVSMLAPPERVDEIAGLLGRIRRGERIAHFDTVRRTKDGRDIHVSLTLSPITNETGEVVGASSIARDVTAQRRAEEKIRDLVRELEAFSYSVSHDLRAPLRAIVGFSQTIAEDHAAALDDEGRRLLGRIVAAGERMRRLIDELLAFSRLSRAEMRRVAVDLTGLAEEIAAELREADPERDVDIVIEDGLRAVGDPGLLRALLENLLGNAWKFSARNERARIEVGVEPPHNGTPLAFYVKDDGVGFDMAYQEKLFTPFQRLHAASDFDGSGIGLATVQRIARRHGGEVWAESEVGAGATFYFTLGERWTIS